MAVKDFVEKLEGALGELVMLEIVTAVGTVQPTTRDDKGRKVPLAVDKGAKILRTRINLLQGDITVEMDPAFATGDLQGLRSFHADQEKQAADILRANVEAIKSLVVFLEGRVAPKG